MRALETTTDYDRFTIDQPAEPSLSLDEAVKKAAELRKEKPTHFYRIVSIDDKLSGFSVRAIPAAEVYSDFVARMAKTLGKLLSRSIVTP